MSILFPLIYKYITFKERHDVFGIQYIYEYFVFV
jgi:hypothetical protein